MEYSFLLPSFLPSFPPSSLPPSFPFLIYPLPPSFLPYSLPSQKKGDVSRLDSGRTAVKDRARKEYIILLIVHIFFLFQKVTAIVFSTALWK
jgi:hypothetical protein